MLAFAIGVIAGLVLATFEPRVITYVVYVYEKLKGLAAGFLKK